MMREYGAATRPGSTVSFLYAADAVGFITMDLSK